MRLDMSHGWIGQADQAQEHVEEPELGVVEPPPHHRGGDRARDHRREVQRLEELAKREAGVEEHGEQQAEGGGDGHDDEDVDERVPCRLLERAIDQELPEILQPDEGEAPAQELDAIDAVEERLDRRRDAEGTEQDDDRRDEEVGVPDVPGVEPEDQATDGGHGGATGRRDRGSCGPEAGRSAPGPRRRYLAASAMALLAARSASARASSSLASWCHVFWMAPPIASITPFRPRFTGAACRTG